VAKASSQPSQGNHGGRPAKGLKVDVGPRGDIDFAVVVTVAVTVEAVEPPGVTEAGATVQVANGGAPAQVNDSG
jgi:hypothetical protein